MGAFHAQGFAFSHYIVHMKISINKKFSSREISTYCLSLWGGDRGADFDLKYAQVIVLLLTGVSKFFTGSCTDKLKTFDLFIYIIVFILHKR